MPRPEPPRVPPATLPRSAEKAARGQGLAGRILELVRRRPAGSGVPAWRRAEDAAAAALAKAGYRVLARNARTPHGEIDIVAERRGALVFVEVKARRRGGSAGGPEDALTRTKIRRVARAAAHLAAAKGMADAPREFLGAAVDLADDGSPGPVRLIPVEDVA